MQSKYFESRAVSAEFAEVFTPSDTASGAQANYDYINKRIDGSSYVLDKPLAAGSYTAKVIAYNSKDIKLAESPDDIKFSVKGDGSH